MEYENMEYEKMQYEIKPATPTERQIVTQRVRALMPRLWAFAPQQSKLLRSLEAATRLKASDGLHLRLKYLCDEFLEDERHGGEEFPPDLKRLTGMLLVDTNAHEIDKQGKRVKTGPKPRTAASEWAAAGLDLSPNLPGPPKEFPVQINLRVSAVEKDGLDRIREKTGEAHSEIIRRLVREADPAPAQ